VLILRSFFGAFVANPNLIGSGFDLVLFSDSMDNFDDEDWAGAFDALLDLFFFFNKSGIFPISYLFSSSLADDLLKLKSSLVSFTFYYDCWDYNFERSKLLFVSNTYSAGSSLFSR